MSTEEQSAGNAAPEAANQPQNAPAAATPEAPAAAAAGAAASAPAVETGNDSPGTDSDSDDDSDGDDAGTEVGATEGADAAAPGDPAKRKRKRRRKKKRPEGAAAEGAAGAEGAEAKPAGEGGAAAEGGKPGGGPGNGRDRNKNKKPREQRERPPFALGDIVFGKVQDVTDDVLFVDLSSKAIGIFDLRELLIQDNTPEAAPAEKDESAEAASATETTPEAPAEQTAAAEGASVEGAQAEAAPEGSTTSTAEETAAAEAAVPAESPGPQLPVVILQPGAQFVGVVHNDGGRGGLVVLTHHPDRASRAKPMVSKAHKDGTLVYGIVTGVIKGGVEVDVDGLRAFAPASHMDLRMGSDLHPWVGQRLPFAVTEYGKRGRDVVLSRRQILESEGQQKREEALKHLTVGAEIEGTVRTVVPFGAFIDIGGIEGLVPLSEMSHNRGDQPQDVFKVGEKVQVKLLRIDEKNKLWLSRRALVEDPWAKVREKYAPGSKHTGKVARIHPIGVFVELEPGVDGLIRRGDLSFKTINDPSEIGVVEGAEIEVVVAHADGGAHRIALHPTLKGDEANEAPQKVAMNKGVKVKVVAAEAGGLQVRILGMTGWQARGFVPASATGTPRGTELRKDFPVGKELDAKVIDLDSRKGEVKLSIRALAQDTEREAYNAYRQQVKREAKFGTFADLLSKHVGKE